MKAGILIILKNFLSNIICIPDAIRILLHKTKPSLSEVLLKEKVISLNQLHEALEAQKEKPCDLGRMVVDAGYADESAVIRAVKKYYGISVSRLPDNIEEVINKRQSFLEKVSNMRIPIRVKLSIAITFIIWLTILILSFVILERQKENLYQQTVKTGKVSLSYFVNNARIPLLNDDILRLNTLIKEAASVEGLLYAVIVDRDNIIKAHTDHTQIGSSFQSAAETKRLTKEEDISYFSYKLPSGANALNLSRPVAFKDKEVGTVHVGISLDFIKKQIGRESFFILVMSLLIVFLGIAIAVLLGFSFSRPISELVLATKEIGKGNFQYRLSTSRKDEFGDLATAFNFMSQELWKKLQMQKSFGRYVSPEIIDMILANPEESWLKGSRSEATVLFTDVRGFTSYSETREPEEVIEALNEYFGIVTGHILEYGGYVDKFIGDAALAVFCVPIHHPDHAERALKAAIAMQKDLQGSDMKKNWLLSRIGIGINSGVVVSGNLGSQIKMEYTVIGDSVNVASRINGLAGPGDIIISKSTYLLTKDLVSVNALPPQKVKGKSEPVEIFQVTGLI
ncbi:MAG: adenylate/guanylate cyclase domain-containing protein [Nitrospirota bacterium]